MTTTQTTEAAPITIPEEVLQEAEKTPVDPLAELERNWAREEALRDQVDINNDEAYADWYANRTLAVENEIERVKLQAEVRLRQLEGRLRGLAYVHEPAVAVAVERLLKAKTQRKGTKSIDLPSGRLGFRTQPLSVVFDSNEAVQKFAESYGPAANCYAVVTPPPVVKVDKRELKSVLDKYAQENGGAYPDGIAVTGGADSFYVAAPKGQGGKP